MKTSELAALWQEHPGYDYEIQGNLYEDNTPRIAVSLDLFRAIGAVRSKVPLFILVDHRDQFVLIQEKEVPGSVKLTFDSFGILATWFSVLNETAPKV